MSQFEINSQSQIPVQERSKFNSNRYLGTNSLNGYNQNTLEQNESVPQASSQPNKNQQTGSKLASDTLYDYSQIGQPLIKDQDQSEQIQKLTKEIDTLKYQWRALEQENQRLKYDNIQLNQRNKSSMNEIQELQDQILISKNENKRLTSIVQEDQFLLIDVQKLRKQVELNRGLDFKIIDLDQQLISLNKQLLESKKQNAFLESELQNQKEIIEKYKSQIRDQTLAYESQVLKNEQLLNDNRKMKLALDSINQDLNQEQEQNQILNQKLSQISLGAKDQISNLQKSQSNLNLQNEQLKNQINLLQQKEKELQVSQTLNIQQESKIGQINQQLNECIFTRQIEESKAAISSAKAEYNKLATTCQQQDQEIKKLKEKINSMTQQNTIISNKCTQLEKSLEEGQQKSQMLSQDLKGKLEKWKNYGTQLEQELKKRETALVNLGNDYIKSESQLKAALDMQSQLRNERTTSIGKLKEMHADLLTYEKKSDSLERNIVALQAQIQSSYQHQERLEQEKQVLNQELKQLVDELRRIQNQCDLRDRDIQDLRSQNSLLAERNITLEHELSLERDKQLQLDSKVRTLENEIHKLNFQHTLRQQYSWNIDPQQSLGNSKPLFPDLSQDFYSPQTNIQGINSPKYPQYGIQVQPNHKSTEVQNSGFENLSSNPIHQIKNKNYNSKFQIQPENQLN
ncbi:unnamed protein product (macronuclear) [Paramecium tetraurelia]|uniref:Uncharacterized protein n=1 Tax=Paramecium tetraurelia TaxID=5888 RepID=A0D914_PARTE|nr:uncharacterized protein GSPATT00014477001 [Paramecium tetraurelia]CAK79531.1 unnamed protein product [Paramecium tetraurelia]|eukprot:XP_001446928.1 hypothetical protein (macronuclear) [Paramecium tetraurelia strain d4-2]